MTISRLPKSAFFPAIRISPQRLIFGLKLGDAFVGSLPQLRRWTGGDHGANGSRLQPLEYQGRWLLPEAVLSDPDYIDQRDFLSSLPTEDVTIEILDS